MSSLFQEITEVLQVYFDGLYYSDTKRLAQVFHPNAIYVCAVDVPLKQLTMESYFPIVDQRPSPASRNEQRRDKIVSIELAGNVTAIARVECAIGSKHFIDLLTLIRVSDRWQIISKVFHYDLSQK